MRSVHIPNGGRAGALLVTDRGTRPLRPLPVGVLSLLKSINELCRAVSATSDKSAREKLSRSLVTIANLAVGRVEGVVGPLEGEAALIFQDDDGGFTCGSTGKPPVPFPWPPLELPSVGDLIKEGFVEAGVVDMIRAAREKGLNLLSVFEDPASNAKKLGVSLSTRALADLEALSPARISTIKDPIDREVVTFFHSVARDGRFLDNWHKRPVEVADELKTKLSPAAVEKIISGELSGAFANPGWRADVGGSIIIIVAADTVIITVVAVTSRSDLSGTIVDRSTRQKI